MERTIDLNGIPTAYTLERKRVKNVNLRVHGGALFVSAPRWIPLAAIESFLRSRADFILGALERTAGTALPCAEGEALFWHGRALTLALGRASRVSLRVEGDVLRLALRAPDDGESVRRALDKCFRAESEALCRAALERLWPRFAALGVPRPEIRMRSMRSCWGNCRPAKRVVTFNARLAAVPEDCVEYVVAHELTHFLHADHSPAFYAALACVIPDWQARRRRLRAFSSVLND
ncbi:MAG: M48 family metallopeptidase [Oscillospiraceae bacterium]|nr:M48 family metallopeptidase [Oscillospiraceae bacterium]